MRYTVLAGRILFSTIFIIASAGHFQQQTVDFATWRGVPLAGVLVPLSGVMALMGGLSILVGFQARLGAWVLVAFLIPVTLVMHNFWGVTDSAAQQIERAMFMKNLTMTIDKPSTTLVSLDMRIQHAQQRQRELIKKLMGIALIFTR